MLGSPRNNNRYLLGICPHVDGRQFQVTIADDRVEISNANKEGEDREAQQEIAMNTAHDSSIFRKQVIDSRYRLGVREAENGGRRDGGEEFGRRDGGD